MTPEISERAFEEAIECALLQYGPGTMKLSPESAREYIRMRIDSRMARRDSDASPKEAV